MSLFFTIFYNFILILLYILAIPFLLFKARKEKYKKAIPAKFFLYKNTPFENEGVWFHSCSMGETKAIEPLVKEYLSCSSISVITNTGFAQAKKITSNVKYLPFEIFLPFWVKKQKVLVVMEAELWYMLFYCAKRKGTRTILINARISSKSYRSYKRFSFFYKKVFNNIDKVFAQSCLDAQRLKELGAKNVEVIGNIKLAQSPSVVLNLKKPDCNIITAASTHENEEKLILNFYKKEYGKLIIVPRHPERFNEVDKIIQNYIKNKNLTYHKYSDNKDLEKDDIILIDSLGILNDIYAITDLVILGGSFEKLGGHNPVEPAYFNCKIIIGQHNFNIKSVLEHIENYYIIKNNELESTLKNYKNLKKSKLKKVGTYKEIKKEIDKWL